MTFYDCSAVSANTQQNLLPWMRKHISWAPAMEEGGDRESGRQNKAFSLQVPGWWRKTPIVGGSLCVNNICSCFLAFSLLFSHPASRGGRFIHRLMRADISYAGCYTGCIDLVQHRRQPIAKPISLNPSLETRHCHGWRSSLLCEAQWLSGYPTWVPALNSPALRALSSFEERNFLVITEGSEFDDYLALFKELV